MFLALQARKPGLYTYAGDGQPLEQIAMEG